MTTTIKAKKFYVDNYLEHKIKRYIDYLDSIDVGGVYRLEYDTDVPTIDEMLNSVDQHCTPGGSYGGSKIGVNRIATLEEPSIYEQIVLEAQKIKREEESRKLQEKTPELSRQLKNSVPMFQTKQKEIKDKWNGSANNKLAVTGALIKINEDEEVIRLQFQDVEHLTLESSSEYLNTVKVDAESNIRRLKKELYETAGSMPVDEYTNKIELLASYLNRKKIVNILKESRND
tara:strand:- start:146 stop:838 length:693 start_codon:yes stop_codon:yes gene_type:complete